MLSNFHTHTERCTHAYGTEADYAETAYTMGLGILGFSDHGPFPDEDMGYRMDFNELPLYLSEIDKLSEKYKGKIQLYKGLEIEYHPKYMDYYRQLYDKFNMEFIANYFTVFPRFAYALSNNAFSLVRYIFFIARQNSEVFFRIRIENSSDWLEFTGFSEGVEAV